MSLHDVISGRGRAALRRNASVEVKPSTGEEELGGCEIVTPAGPVYSITLPPLPAAPEPARPGPALRLWQHIELVYGVGPVMAAKLRAEGYGDLRELAHHHRWQTPAREIVKAIERADLPALRAAGARDAELACYFSMADFAVIDIETTGLARALPLFLVGLAWLENGSWQRRQLFARGFEEERAVLLLTAALLAERPGLVSYNGRAFDEPYVKARLAVHRMKPPGFLLHYDVYQETRRLSGLANRKLPTVVQHMLGETRGDDTPGSLAPELYFAYVKERRPELIKPVLEHNAQDVTDLCRLFELARLASYGCGDTAWDAWGKGNDPPKGDPA